MLIMNYFYCFLFFEIGCDERTNLEGHAEYLLVLSYCPTGCLQDYLNENVLDFQTFCKMASNVAKGVAHLHTDLIKGGMTTLKLNECWNKSENNIASFQIK